LAKPEQTIHLNQLEGLQAPPTVALTHPPTLLPKTETKIPKSIPKKTQAKKITAAVKAPAKKTPAKNNKTKTVVAKAPSKPLTKKAPLDSKPSLTTALQKSKESVPAVLVTTHP
jgi:hypothetical protein